MCADDGYRSATGSDGERRTRDAEHRNEYRPGEARDGEPEQLDAPLLNMYGRIVSGGAL